MQHACGCYQNVRKRCGAHGLSGHLRRIGCGQSAQRPCATCAHRNSLRFVLGFWSRPGPYSIVCFRFVCFEQQHDSMPVITRNARCRNWRENLTQRHNFHETPRLADLRLPQALAKVSYPSSKPPAASSGRQFWNPLYESSSESNWFMSLGLPWPFIAFMHCPTKKPSKPVLPPL